MKTLILAGLLLGSVAFASNRESGGMEGSVAIYMLFDANPSVHELKALQAVEKELAQAQAKGLLNQRTSQRTSDGATLLCARYADVMVHREQFLPKLTRWILGGTIVDAPPSARIFVGANCGQFKTAVEVDLRD